MMQPADEQTVMDLRIILEHTTSTSDNNTARSLSSASGASSLEWCRNRTPVNVAEEGSFDTQGSAGSSQANILALDDCASERSERSFTSGPSATAHRHQSAPTTSLRPGCAQEQKPSSAGPRTSEPPRTSPWATPAPRGSVAEQESTSGRACGSLRCAERARFERLFTLQHGSSGKVSLALDKDTGQQVAIKYIPRSEGASSETVAREILIQCRCARHPHVIQLQDMISTEEHMGIVMEYAAGGDLREFIENYAQTLREQPHGGLPEEDARWFFQQLVLAVDYCHKLGIAHRDIKLENALLDRSSPDAVLKLCDFGYSNCASDHPEGPVPCCRAVGTPEYMAPEMLMTRSYDGKAADVWSCGVMLYAMLTGNFPFWRPSDDNAPQDSMSRLKCMCSRIVAAHYTLPDYLSHECCNLLRGMLTVDPAKRLTIAQIMAHPWYTEHLPRDVGTLNEKLLGMPVAQRTSCFRQAGCPLPTAAAGAPLVGV